MKYHFIGIKGAGMSALAQIMYDLGNEVVGSDKSDYFFTQVELDKRGIKLLEYNEFNIKSGLVIIVGNSILSDHIEYVKARELGLEIYTYQEMLTSLTDKYKTITIAGCHGKTTTTSMLSHVMGGINGCNYLIGDGTGGAKGDSDYFVLEACEYRRHFLNYTPDYAIITNIDLDHPDYFEDIDDVVDAYNSYSLLASKMVIACGDDLYTRKLRPNVDIIYYGIDSCNDVIAINIKVTSNCTSFDVLVKGEMYGHFDLPIFGNHLILDALAVISVCYYEGLSSIDVCNNFKTFGGAARRYSEVVVGNNILVDDYAHHPVEVKATIETTKLKYPGKKIICIFQPHTFSRTLEFKEDFINIFNTVDKTFLLKIHPAREKQEDFLEITSDVIANNIDNCEVIKMDDYAKLCNLEDCVLLFMSPNDLSILENGYIEMRNANGK